MSLKRVATSALYCLRIGVASLTLFQFSIGDSLANAQPQSPGGTAETDTTTTPIQHVIVIIGENRSFDHVFATYMPQNGQTVWNLLSEGVVNADGTRGPNFYTVEQTAAVDMAADGFLLNPSKVPFQKGVLPAPLVGGPHNAASYFPTTVPFTNPPEPYSPTQLLALAAQSENGLPPGVTPLLLTGGALLPTKTPDTRIADVNSLPPGPFQLTNGNTFLYDYYAASPVHRFYQMWQQLDCSLDHATPYNPSGCDALLFPWVEVATGAGSSTQLNGLPQPANFSTEYAPPPTVTTGEGATSMAFYNVLNGDVPYFKMLADTYAMSDNFHQSVDGGTGANHIMLGHGDAIWFSDGNGNALPPPSNEMTGGTTPAGTPTILDEVENPIPQAGTNNWWIQDGYGGGSYGSPAYGGGSYSNCADPTQPGVSTIVAYLASINIDPRCEAGHYYLLNNYNPGYFGNGNNAFTDPSPLNTVFTIPPSSTPSIGDKMLAAGISWKYYGDQWDNYVPDPYQINYGPAGSLNSTGTAIITDVDEYCNICNPFQYDTSIMSNPAVRTAHIQDTADLYNDIQNGTLPAVSFVKPSGLVDGHPSSSKLDLFEGFAQKIVQMVQANPNLWASTAIFITFDEGGGYYDSGYVQPLDFFGDGTRIPMIVVSPYATGGRITHDYADHVSVLKFIERNWSLSPVTKRSRDNFPNPISTTFNPYVPLNGPAISDLFELFDFTTNSAGNTVSTGWGVVVDRNKK
jgi:phospholipase C